MAEVCTLEWQVTPMRADHWLAVWESAAARMPAFGARSWSLIRSEEDPLSFLQTGVWERRSDFERYWYSEEIEAARTATIGWYDLPMLPTWHTLIAAE